MSAQRLRELVLEEGLEDLIPLPEIAATVEIQRVAAPDSLVQELSEVLVSLLSEERIQIWSGHWSEEALPVEDLAGAEQLLKTEEKYRFSSPADLRSRVYYVNVENLRF